MHLEKNLNHRAFKAIEDGDKTVEIRANKARNDQPSFNTAVPGDTVIFSDNKTGDSLECEIRRIALYDTVRYLLETEGTKHTLSSGNDIEEAVNGVRSIPGYADFIDANAVFAVQIRATNS
jgi:ASC-1-like (ASCH) protein